jgi:hypothetical protein
MKLRPIATCALFGGIASLYGLGIALMPLVTGLFTQDLAQLVPDQRASSLIVMRQSMAQGLSMRMLGVSAACLVFFVGILILDHRQSPRRV